MAKRNGKSAGGQKTSPSELGTLAPKPVVWDIGGTLFEQKPLRIDRLSDVMEEITDIVLDQGRGVIFDRIIDAAAAATEEDEEDGGVSNPVDQATMPIIIRMLVSIPKRLPKIVSMILLDVKEQYLRDHMSARQAIQIVKTFIEQNEIGALIQDFFGLVTSVKLSVNQATAEIKQEAEMETVRGSDSETAEETEEV